MTANIDKWHESMLKFGKKHADYMIDHQDDTEVNPVLGATYYDAERVFTQIAQYTGDASWMTAADAANKVYVDRYVVPNNGGVTGYWKFPHGMAMRYKRNPTPESKAAFNMLAHKGAYNSDTTPIPWLLDVGKAREVAYAINCLVLQERVFAGPHRRYLDELYLVAVNHIQQWAWTRTAPYCQPFMAGIIADALILYDENGFAASGQVRPIIRVLADFLWDTMWVPEGMAFKYVDKVVKDVGGPTPSPDLNQLIAPMYGWLYMKTGEAVFLERGNQIFNGGVQKAWLDGGKQFNQNYRSSFNYLRWTGQIPDVTDARAS